MTSSTPSSPSVAAASGPRTPASQGVALIRTSVSQAKEFLTPILVSIGVEIGTVVLLMALLLLMISTRSGDGGDAGGGSGNGTSGQGGTGEFVAPDSGSGTGADVTKVHANSGTSTRSQSRHQPHHLRTSARHYHRRKSNRTCSWSKTCPNLRRTMNREVLAVAMDFLIWVTGC